MNLARKEQQRRVSDKLVNYNLRVTDNRGKSKTEIKMADWYRHRLLKLYMEKDKREFNLIFEMAKELFNGN